jgi:hypothetical protein
LGSKTVESGLQPDYDSFGELHKRSRFKSFHPTGNLHFASHLAQHLPEVAAQHMNESDWGILNLEVGALKQATRDAIARRDWHTVCRHLACVEDLYEKAGAELRDALGVSYLGNLLYGEISLNYAKARSLLPRSLAIAPVKIERHYEELSP